MKRDPEATNARVRQVVDDLKRYCPRRIILFGSAARGDADEFSDLDFVVIKATNQSFLERMREVALMTTGPGAMDFFVYTPEEWARLQEQKSPFAEQVIQDGQVVYEAPS